MITLFKILPLLYLGRQQMQWAFEKTRRGRKNLFNLIETAPHQPPGFG